LPKGDPFCFWGSGIFIGHILALFTSVFPPSLCVDSRRSKLNLPVG